MLTRLARIPLLALLFAYLPACGPVDFQGQSLALRHDEAADTLDLELHYQGVLAATATWTERQKSTGAVRDIDAACDRVESMAAGKRYFMLFNNILPFDLDDIENEFGSDPTPDSDRILAMVQVISVEYVEVRLDPKGRIAITQHLRLRNAKDAMGLLNHGLRKALLELHERGDLDGETPAFLDDQTRAALVAEARAGRDWISWSGSDLLISFPATLQSGARLLATILGSQARTEVLHARTRLPALFLLMSSLELKDGRLSMVLSAGEDGYLRLELEEDPLEYDETLLEALRARDFAFSSK